MKLSNKRRLFLKSAVATSSLGVAISAGLLTPSAVLASWPETAFTAKSSEDAINALFGATATQSDKVIVDVNDVAENGAIVPVTIKTSLENVENMSILINENTSPMTASFNLQPEFGDSVSIRVKVAKPSDIIGVVKAGGKLYSNKKHVKVTQGGCG